MLQKDSARRLACSSSAFGGEERLDPAGTPLGTGRRGAKVRKKVKRTHRVCDIIHAAERGAWSIRSCLIGNWQART